MNTEKATFAGGCFWCMVHPFDKMEGVIKVISGYTGGPTAHPTYEEVSSGDSGHYEAIQITYNPDKISYKELLEVFWKQVDPTDQWGQFADKGPQYRTAIFYHSEEQKRLADESKGELERTGKFRKPLATEIIKAKDFFAAEEYHQDYYKKNPAHYLMYRKGSGRELFLKKYWE